jgi:VWFA-related protein
MNSRIRRIYLFCVAGAVGGLLAAIVHQWVMLGPLLAARTYGELLRLHALLGMCIGSCIGFFPRFSEAFGQRTFGSAVRSGFFGAALGAVGGALAVPAAQVLHEWLGGGYLGRGSAVAFLGAAVGFSESFYSGARRFRGIAGGAVGGLLAGVLLERLTTLSVPPADTPILGLLLLGISIPAGVALFTHIRAEAWLEGVRGAKVTKQVYHLARFDERNRAVLGSGAKAHIFVPGAEAEHATLAFTESGTVLQSTAREQATYVNGAPVRERALRDSDRLEVASAEFIYHEGKRRPEPVAKRVRIVSKASAVFFLAVAAIQPQTPTDVAARIESVRPGPGRRVSVTVRVTDNKGKSLTSLDQVRLTLFEDGQQVAEKNVAERQPSASVLAIDVSGSMFGEKAETARDAARGFVANAPSWHEIAVVGFGHQAHLLTPLSTDRRSVSDGIAQLQPVRLARTALNDGIWLAIEQVRGRPGRRSVLVLTDGIENNSRHTQDDVVRFARDAGVTLFVIGLGGDVKTDYLQRLAEHGGRYLPAERAGELRALFVDRISLLRSEHEFQYMSPRGGDGTRRNLEVRATVWRGTESAAETRAVRRYVSAYFIPAYRGDLTLYSAGVAGAVATPFVWSFAASLIAVRRFRRRWLHRLNDNHRFIGMRDANALPGQGFTSGDPVIECPGRCRRPHHLRSWRNNRCSCMHEYGVGGFVCYHRALPAWLRRWLDSLSGEHTTRSGRRWLCRCAGDNEGY